MISKQLSGLKRYTIRFGRGEEVEVRSAKAEKGGGEKKKYSKIRATQKCEFPLGNLNQRPPEYQDLGAHTHMK